MDNECKASRCVRRGADEAMGRIVDKVVDGVVAQREEILRAFVAKYGFQPDEAVQVVGNDGAWRVIRRSDMYADEAMGRDSERLDSGRITFTVWDALAGEHRQETLTGVNLRAAIDAAMRGGESGE